MGMYVICHECNRKFFAGRGEKICLNCAFKQLEVLEEIVIKEKKSRRRKVINA